MNDILNQDWITTSDAAESRVGDEIVLLHLVTGIYFGLDAVGARVWDGLKSRLSPKTICEEVSVEFNEELGRVQADVRAFLTQLSEHLLIEQK